MKRPVAGTFAILALLAGGLYLGLHYRDRGEKGVTLSGPAARKAIISNFSLALPPSAADVYYREEMVERGRMVFMTFVVPPVELPSIFDAGHSEPQFPRSGELKEDAALFKLIAAVHPRPDREGDQTAHPEIDWWAPASLPGQPFCAQRTGRRGTSPVFKWRLLVGWGWCDEQKMLSKVYVVFSEETANGD